MNSDRHWKSLLLSSPESEEASGPHSAVRCITASFGEVSLTIDACRGNTQSRFYFPF